MISNISKLKKYYKKYESKTFGEENQLNAALYDTKIIQGLYERINELEDRIEKLEKNKGGGGEKNQ